MDAPCKIQGSIHVFRLVNNMCPGKWVHINTLLAYYFSWFYSNKGVIVGRRIAYYIPDHMIPPAFIAVIERAKVLSLESSIMKIG